MDLLPIGSVVSLKNSEHKVMITGLLQIEAKEDKKLIWDYSGCFYPIGMQGANKCILFNEDHIERLYAIGYQDEEQFAFMKEANSTREKLKAKLTGIKNVEKTEE